MRNELISVTALLRQLEAFWHWWREELVSLLPAVFRRQLQYSEHQLVCSFSGEGVQLIDCRHAQVEHRVDITPDGQGELNAVQQAQLDQLRSQGGEQVVIRLPQEQVLALSFPLPLEAESNLDEVLGYELGRHAPFKIEQVYYDYTIKQRGGDERKLWVSVAVVPRNQVETLLSQVRGWGLLPAAVTVAGLEPSPCALGEQNLLPKSERIAGGSSVNLLQKLLLLSALLLLLALAGFPLLMQQLRITELQRQVDVVREDAAGVQSMQREMESLAAEATFVDEKKRQYPEVLDVIANLTQLLPDDTWLERFEMKGERIRIQGMSADASLLIELLENSPLLQKVSFDSPIVKDSRTDRFRFQIVAELVQGGGA